MLLAAADVLSAAASLVFGAYAVYFWVSTVSRQNFGMQVAAFLFVSLTLFPLPLFLAQSCLLPSLP
eukprot:scaffold228_cov312-Pinguiococcus_pyrenoidosus.AAC.2